MVAVVCGILAVTFNSMAAQLLAESFSYSDGPLVTMSGGTWNTHSGTSGQMDVISGRVDMRVPATEDVSTTLTGQPYPTATSTVLYASFTARITALPSPGGQYFAHFRNNSTGFRAKVFAQTTGAGAGLFRLGIANAANTASVTNDLNLSLDTDYRVYIRYVVSNATSSLWVDPASEASPSVSAMDSASAQTITSFALRQDSGIGIIALDDLHIGTSFADVQGAASITAPTITMQPATTSAIESGAATFAVAVSGTQPFGYQWKFNGSSISGATNTTLTLTGITTNSAGLYSVSVTNVGGFTNSTTAALTVIEPNASGTLMLVHYNVKGNFASDWSTNAAQVQAIARQLQYLNPDIITLNEIPNGKRHEMTNWMTAFFPTYQLAVSSGTDGVLRSGVISRFPIARSQSWLENSSLTNFGYNGSFTRDLFEAEISVPGAAGPLHVFTTHLKSSSDGDSQDRRAAECSAISNFFATIFIPTNGWRPYVVTGDLNEDIAIPMSHGNQPVQRLTSTPTGLRLTTPLNPFTLESVTHSIQGNLDARFDYVLPSGLLFSNIVNSQVFRTDLLPSPPPPLQSNDDIVASDHLPVVTVFNYPDPPLRPTLTLSNQSVVLNWPALVGRKFQIESSTNLATWTVAASNLVSLSSQVTWNASVASDLKYFRVVRLP